MSQKEERYYLEPLKCEECESTVDVHGDRYNHWTICLDCINEKLSGQSIKEGYYTDKNEGEIYRERNL